MTETTREIAEKIVETMIERNNGLGLRLVDAITAALDSERSRKEGEWNFDMSAAPLWSGEGYPPFVLLWNGYHRGVGYRATPNYPDDPEFVEEGGAFIEPAPIAWQDLPLPPIQQGE